MGKEYEIQVLEVDVTSMRKKLKKLKGKRIHKSIKFVRSVFNRCNSKIRSFVRVRNEGKKTTMTIKIYNDPKFPDEHEVTIEDVILVTFKDVAVMLPATVKSVPISAKFGILVISSSK